MSDPSSSLRCPHCPNSTRTFTPHGLKVHIGHMHKHFPQVIPSNPRLSVSQQAHGNNPIHLDFGDLATLKQSVRVLRHIPKGARNLAAAKLSDLIDKCIDSNGTLEWFSLLSFAYSALKSPEASATGNLTTKVKRNINSASFDISGNIGAETTPLRSHSILKTIERKVHEGDLRCSASAYVG